MSEITAEEVYEKAASGLVAEFGNLLTYLYRDKSLFPPRMDELVGGGMDWVSPETEQSWLRWLRCARAFGHLTEMLVVDHAGAPDAVAIPGVTENAARVAAGVYEGAEAGLREFDKLYGSIYENEGLFWFYADTRHAASLTAWAAGEPGLGERG